MTNVNIDGGGMHPFFHPAAHYSSPAEVLNDKELSISCLHGHPTCTRRNPAPICGKSLAPVIRYG